MVRKLVLHDLKVWASLKIGMEFDHSSVQSGVLVRWTGTGFVGGSGDYIYLILASCVVVVM